MDGPPAFPEKSEGKATRDTERETKRGREKKERERKLKNPGLAAGRKGKKKDIQRRGFWGQGGLDRPPAFPEKSEGKATRDTERETKRGREKKREKEREKPVTGVSSKQTFLPTQVPTGPYLRNPATNSGHTSAVCWWWHPITATPTKVGPRENILVAKSISWVALKSG